ncbi:MAG: hypothetical protein AAFP22_08075, partial [Planctomycetota bacterium]
AGRVPASTRAVEAVTDAPADGVDPRRPRKSRLGPARLSSDDSPLPQNTARIQRFRDEYARWQESEEHEDATTPGRRYLLLPVESFVKEFGHPTHCGQWNGGFRCTWVIDGGWVSAHFVDGYCMQVEA